MMKKVICTLTTLSIITTIMSLSITYIKEKNKEFEAKTDDNAGIGQPIDIDKITTDMIINWKDEYLLPKYNDKGEYENKMVKCKAKNLWKYNFNSKTDVIKIIFNNLYEMVKTKITGLPNYTYLETQQFFIGKRDFSDVEVKTYLIWKKFLTFPFTINLSNTKSFNIITFDIKSIVSSKIDDNTIIIYINLKRWDEIKYLIQVALEEYKKGADLQLRKSEEQMKKEIRENKESYKGLTNEEVEKIAKNWIQYAKAIQKTDLNSIKTLYDLILIKEKGKTIVINLRPKNTSQ